MIYKISDDNRSIIVEEKSSEKSYEEFRQKLTSSVENGQPVPRYAVYDVEYDLKDDGRRYTLVSRKWRCLLITSRATTVFISWVPDGTSTKVIQHSIWPVPADSFAVSDVICCNQGAAAKSTRCQSVHSCRRSIGYRISTQLLSFMFFVHYHLHSWYSGDRALGPAGASSLFLTLQFHLNNQPPCHQ